MDTLSGSTLTIDIGGTGIKAMALNPQGEPVSERSRQLTPRPATPKAVLKTAIAVAQEQPAFQRVSVGFPGVVVNNIVHTAPNLDGAWAGFALGAALQRALERPVRVCNDADVQGYGAIEGKGVEMVLTLGTGLGSALFVDGRLVPNLELAHHPFQKKRSYEDYVGKAALRKVGAKKWNKRVREVLAQVQPIWNPSVIYVGGGNAKKLKGDLPQGVKVVPNVAGLLGGIKLWAS